MEPWQILGVGLGVALVVAQLWRRSRSTQNDPVVADGGRSNELNAGATEVWIELDVEPLFPSSEPVSQEYLLDVTESGETD